MSNVFELKNGAVLLVTEAAGGVYAPGQLRKVAEISETHDAVIKISEDQRVCLAIPPDQVETLSMELAEVGLSARPYQTGLHQPTACLGELCPHHEQPALEAAVQITERLADIQTPQTFRIGINGCARACVPTHTLDLSLVGGDQGYHVSVGGKQSMIPELARFLADGVPSSELPERIAKIVQIYAAGAQEGESFLDMIERAGMSELVAALAPYSQDAAQDDGTAAFGISGEDTGSVDSETTTDIEGTTASEAAEVARTDDDLMTSDLDVTLQDEVSEGPSVEISPDERAELEMAADIPIGDDPMSDGAASDPESAVEAELEESIQEEAQIPKFEDELSEDRNQALQMLEEESAAVAGVNSGAEDEVVDLEETPIAGEDDIELSDDLDHAEDLDTSTAAPAQGPSLELADESEQDLQATPDLSGIDLEEDTFDAGAVAEDAAALTKDIAEDDAVESDIAEESMFSDGQAPAPSAPTLVSAKNAAELASQGSATWTITGITTDSQGQLRLNFANQGYMTLDFSALSLQGSGGGSRNFQVGDQRVVLSRDSGGYKVFVDGIALWVPHRRAA